MQKPGILAIDQGTTSSRAIIFDEKGAQIAIAQVPIEVTFPRSGWVNQDARQLWLATRQACEESLAFAGLTWSSLVAIGITNQRETTVLWDRRTGEPLAPAIVWQSRHSTENIEQWTK